MGLENILGVWAGLSLDSGGNTPLTGDALQPYIDDVLNELEVRTPSASHRPPPDHFVVPLGRQLHDVRRATCRSWIL